MCADKARRRGLSDTKIRAARSGDKLVKLTDSDGLQLWLMPSGAKLWRFAYRFGGKQKALAIGAYPALSLAEARERRDAQRKLLAVGRDPSVEKAVSAANTFNALADEYLAQMQVDGRAITTIEKNGWLLGFARPALGVRPIAEVSSGDVLAVLRSIEAGGKRESARRARAIIGGVFRLAIAQGKATNDPTVALRGQLKPPSVQHRAAILDAKPFGGLLRAIWGDEAMDPTTQAALKLAALLAPRPGELRLAEWQEFDLDGAVWAIPAGRMKMRRDHATPLSPEVVVVLRDLHNLTGSGRLVFPSIRSKERSMSDGTMNAALRRLGFTKDQASAHGFRATFSSLANESGKWHPDAIERQLAHADDDAVRGAYARSPYWAERIKMMTWWADECQRLRHGGKVIVLRSTR